jgi:hypothetical protein
MQAVEKQEAGARERVPAEGSLTADEQGSQHEQRGALGRDPKRVVERRERAPAMQARGVLEKTVAELYRELRRERAKPGVDSAREADQQGRR